MQLDGHDLPEIAAALLSWADTLTAVTAHAWRVPSGHSVHLSVTGQLSRGAASGSMARCPSPGAASAPISHPMPPPPSCSPRCAHVTTLAEVTA